MEKVLLALGTFLMLILFAVYGGTALRQEYSDTINNVTNVNASRAVNATNTLITPLIDIYGSMSFIFAFLAVIAGLILFYELVK